MIGTKHQQPLKDAFAGTGVQRRDDQMPGQRRPHRDVGCLLIADLADDQHLRVLAQEMTRGLGKVQSAGLIHLSLHYAGDDLLCRVLDRDDVASTALREVAKAGINRRGLAAARRTGQQQQAGGLAEE